MPSWLSQGQLYFRNNVFKTGRNTFVFQSYRVTFSAGFLLSDLRFLWLSSVFLGEYIDKPQGYFFP
jgi:hypothetical protein